MTPPQVLDHQAALLDHVQDPRYGGFLDALLTDMAIKRKVAVKGSGAGQEFAQHIARSLRVASAFHVQRDMMPVLRAASAELDATDHLVHDRLPSEHGFLIFDDGWVTKEVRGRTIVVSAIQWWNGGATVDDSYGKSVPGIWVVTYTDMRDPRDEINGLIVNGGLTEDAVIRTFGRYQVMHIQFVPYEQRVGPLEIPEGYYDEYVREFPDDFEPDRPAYSGPLPNDSRLIVALFRLLGQTIVDVKDAPLDRASSRRAVRAKIPARVQTIRLRRKVTKYLDPGEGGGVDWQHRWWVRGTWQWRKCSQEHPLAEPYEKGWHARVYVTGHFKGPDDKPVVITNKVFDLAQ